MSQGMEMKFLLSLVLLVVVGSCVYEWGGNSLSEAQVRAFYQRSAEVLAEADDVALCEMLAEDYEQSVVMKYETEQAERVVSKLEYCRDLAATTELLRRYRAQLGRVPMDHKQTIRRITLAKDGQSAEVELSSTLDLPGMRMVSRSRDTIERRRWKVLAKRSVAVVHAGAGR